MTPSNQHERFELAAQAPFAKFARSYRRAGWAGVFPVADKKPAVGGVTGYDGIDADDDQIRAWRRSHSRCNVGLRMPVNVIALDVDLHEGVDGLPTLGAFEEMAGMPLPPTFRIVNLLDDSGTPLPYGHYLFRLPLSVSPEDVAQMVSNLKALGPGVDVLRWMHRYAVAPGSVHRSGRHYLWASPENKVIYRFPSPEELAELPIEFVDALRQLGQRGTGSSRRGGKQTRKRRAHANPAEVEKWLDDRRTGDQEGAWDESVGAAVSKFAPSEGYRHDSALAVSYELVCLADEGAQGAVEAMDVVGQRFAAALGSERNGDTEWEDMVAQAIEKVARLGCDDESFWLSRPLLTSIRDFARARRVSPWALLGCVLARACAAIPPNVVLPPLVGSVGSLNSFVALAGNSGAGKSAAMSAAEDFLQVVGGVAFEKSSPGSGEGLVAAYVRPPRRGEQECVQVASSCLFIVDEVQSLAALANRTASTLIPTMKSAWIGTDLATQNAERSRNRRLARHTYRFAMVVGVQPAHSNAIFDDVGGGFPQRFIWLPTFDASRPPRGLETLEPRPLIWHVPGDSGDGSPIVLRVPSVIKEAVLAAQDAQNVPIGSRPVKDTLDGHAVFAREKIAAIFAILDGRLDLTDEDWLIAGKVMAVSDRTRAEVQRVVASEAARAADDRAKQTGKRNAITADAEADAKRQRATDGITRSLNCLPNLDASIPRSDVRRGLRSDIRPFFNDALGDLICDALAEEVNIEGVAHLKRTG